MMRIPVLSVGFTTVILSLTPDIQTYFERLAEVFVEFGQERLERAKKSVAALVEKAGGQDPARLTAAVLQWDEQNNQSPDPGSYGQNLERIVVCVDFAIWIPWLSRGQPTPL